MSKGDRVKEETKQSAPAAQFVHLHNHSHYSLLDGLQKVPQMLDRIQALGMTAAALTDHGTLSGAIEFYEEAQARGIKPIIGVETYVAPRSHTDKSGRQDLNPYHLILLAYNQQGYQNLMQLVTIAQLEGFYGKPRVDRELLAKYHDGLIALSACAGGEVGNQILDGNLAGAEAVAKWYLETFGEGNYYLELQDHEGWEPQQRINAAKIELGKKLGIPLVLTADAHYSEHKDREAHEVLLCVQTGKNLTDTNRMTMDMDLAVDGPEEITARWSHLPEALENTVKIAERCQWELEFGKILIPRFETPAGQSEREYLHQLCWQGAMWRYGAIAREDITHVTADEARAQLPPEVVERIEYELGVIAKMNYDGYFLIVADFVNWGKNQGIIIGPGRGSAAGSIVAYSMNITDLDPLQYDLLFERFLNPDRISMPDIDLDFQDDRRSEVIDYVTEKYGQDRVAQIITFGTMAARNAVRDTGRVLGMSYGEVDAIAKLVPQPIRGRHIPLATSAGVVRSSDPDYRPNPELSQVYRSNPQAKRLIDLAIQLEGTIRSNGVHAAGVIIAPEPLVNYAPLQRAQKGGIATQYSMGPIEHIGLLKMDFLGLSNLTIIKNALRIIKKVYGKTIEIGEIPLEDPKIYELLTRGDTTGVFQLESAGMKRYLRELKPTRFDDIIAMVALYRPGPMQWIDDFIDRKHGRKEVEYLHPAMESALKTTYGVIVYQEQVMQISKEMCGFTGGQADSLRKAIGKKKPAEMAKMKQDFIDGAIKTVGADRAMMETFWSQLEAFAAYCFPKAHAACYALIAAQTAYLKAHYPAAFLAALMTSDYDNIDRIAIEVAECQRMGLSVLPPDVNESFLEFGVVPETGAIRFGLAAVKNVGSGAIEAIVTARTADGPFAGIEDFARRVSAQECNKKAWESLIRCGAFDSLGERATLLHNLDLIVSYAAKAQKNALSGQIDIFGSLGVEENIPALRLNPPAEVPDRRTQLSWERELLGLYLSRHPLDDYAAFMADTLDPINAITAQSDGRVARIGGMVSTVRRITTRKGDTMAFVGIEDKTGQIELVVFPGVYEKSPELWEVDQVIQVMGKISARDRDGNITTDLKIMADTAKPISYETAQAHRPAKPAARPVAKATPSAASEDPLAGTLQLHVNNLEDQQLLIRVRELLSATRGESEVYLVAGGRRIRLPFKVAITEGLMTQLAELTGPEMVERIAA